MKASEETRWQVPCASSGWTTDEISAAELPDPGGPALSRDVPNIADLATHRDAERTGEVDGGPRDPLDCPLLRYLGEAGPVEGVHGTLVLRVAGEAEIAPIELSKALTREHDPHAQLERVLAEAVGALQIEGLLVVGDLIAQLADPLDLVVSNLRRRNPLVERDLLPLRPGLVEPGKVAVRVPRHLNDDEVRVGLIKSGVGQVAAGGEEQGGDGGEQNASHKNSPFKEKTPRLTCGRKRNHSAFYKTKPFLSPPYL